MLVIMQICKASSVFKGNFSSQRERSQGNFKAPKFLGMQNPICTRGLTSQSSLKCRRRKLIKNGGKKVKKE